MTLSGHNSPVIDVKRLYTVSVKVLDVYYLLRKEVYSELLRRSKALQSKRPLVLSSARVTSVKQQADYMWLAASAIGAASFFINQGTSDQVNESMTPLIVNV